MNRLIGSISAPVRPPRMRGCLVLSLFLLVVFRVPVFAQRDTKANDFRVPELDEQGNLKSMMIGKEARISPGKPMEITGLTVEFYEENKEVNMRIESPKCTYNDRTGLATSDDEVHIEGQGFTIDGKGFEYMIKEERLHILSNTKVVLRNISSQEQPEPATTDSPTP